jgi:hypothetical protein
VAQPHILAANPSLPVKSIKELIAGMRAVAIPWRTK